MKTLDEVIKAYEHCLGIGTDASTCLGCPYADENGEVSCLRHDGCDIDKEDALHYLKEYRAILPLVPSLINTALEVQKKGKTIG